MLQDCYIRVGVDVERESAPIASGHRRRVRLLALGVACSAGILLVSVPKAHPVPLRLATSSLPKAAQHDGFSHQCNRLEFFPSAGKRGLQAGRATGLGLARSTVKAHVFAGIPHLQGGCSCAMATGSEVFEPRRWRTHTLAASANEGADQQDMEWRLLSKMMDTDPETEFHESLYDRFCLACFRLMVRKESGIKSDLPGYKGLMEESKNFMIASKQPEQTKMVVHLMSLIFDPLKPVFEALLVPKGKDPYPWTPIIMSVFTPFFMNFLVGPSKPNLRPEDNKPGGMLIEKCRWLDEANCKGMCVNQCKLPGQEYFYDGLGLPFTMRPNFTSKACQWSFGIHPLPVKDDPEVPKGCLRNCPTKLQPVYDDGGFEVIQPAASYAFHFDDDDQ